MKSLASFLASLNSFLLLVYTVAWTISLALILISTCADSVNFLKKSTSCSTLYNTNVLLRSMSNESVKKIVKILVLKRIITLVWKCWLTPSLTIFSDTFLWNTIGLFLLDAISILQSYIIYLSKISFKFYFLLLLP